MEHRLPNCDHGSRLSGPQSVLGFQPFGEGQIDVKLSHATRERHVYLIGKSGYGKTNLLRTMIFQDLEVGQSHHR